MNPNAATRYFVDALELNDTISAPHNSKTMLHGWSIYTAPPLAHIVDTLAGQNAELTVTTDTYSLDDLENCGYIDCSVLEQATHLADNTGYCREKIRKRSTIFLGNIQKTTPLKRWWHDLIKERIVCETESQAYARAKETNEPYTRLKHELSERLEKHKEYVFQNVPEEISLGNENIIRRSDFKINKNGSIQDTCVLEGVIKFPVVVRDLNPKDDDLIINGFPYDQIRETNLDLNGASIQFKKEHQPGGRHNPRNTHTILIGPDFQLEYTKPIIEKLFFGEL